MKKFIYISHSATSLDEAYMRFGDEIYASRWDGHILFWGSVVRMGDYFRNQGIPLSDVEFSKLTRKKIRSGNGTDLNSLR